MADRKTVQKLMKEIAEDHPEFNNIEFDEAVFRACFEQALPLFPYNPGVPGPDPRQAQLRLTDIRPAAVPGKAVTVACTSSW